ncbi:NUDIX hydrolase [Oceanospirillum beijerinckii]|uniref:NUDIX hydrolase n=1 Tax=Oceanospirillum beijerinckii TaxID=64976 RepID=UPI00040315E6|nr:NUDIX domain-containing protein [Oceanospirillum beijerinckii]
MVKERIAALPLKKRKNQAPQVCLVTSRRHGHWMIPMGKKEKKLSNADVARLEAYEEAGVLGRLNKKNTLKVNTCSGHKKKKRCVFIYPMEVRSKLKRWPEKKQRQRCWVSIKKLSKLLSDKNLAKAITKQYGK